MYTTLKDLPEGRNWTLDELNDREVQLLIPVIILISVVIVVGTVGNALVLYINIVVLKLRNSTHRYLITFLAFVDITFCTIGGSLMIVDLSHPYSFTNTLACKGLHVCASVCAMASIMLLCVIALDRYRRICRPHGNQFSSRSMKYMFGIIAFLSCIFSIPYFILYGQNTVQTGVANITGISCYLEDKYKDTLFANGYNSFMGAVFIILTALVSVFYILVWRQIWKHTQPIQARVLLDTTEGQTQQTTSEVTQRANDPEKYIHNGNTGKNNTDTAKTVRVSKILFVVTTISILSFAPYISLQLLTYFHEKGIENLDNTRTMFYQLVSKSYAINFMVNPFIYGVMNTNFRMEWKKLALKK